MEDLSGFVRKRTKIVIGTKEFTFTELSLKDYAEFKAHLVEQREVLNEKRRVRLLADAQKVGTIDPMELLKLLDSSISEDELEAQTYTIEGIGYLAYLSLRYAHQGISRDQVMEIITLEHVENVANAIFPPGLYEEAKKKLTDKSTEESLK